MKSHLKSDGRYSYGFTESGLFTLLDKKGEPFYPKVLPLVDKILSHLIYLLFWLVLIGIFNCLVPQSLLPVSNRILMSLVVFHLFFLGCRLTTLLMIHPLRPLFFPPLWVRLMRKIAKGGGMELLEKYQLETHEGLLANLRLAEALRGTVQPTPASPHHKS